MGSGRGNNQLTQLQHESANDRAAIQPTPLESKISQNALNLLTDADTGVDVLNTRGFEAKNLYSRARLGQADERKSEGLLTLAGKGNPNQMAAMRLAQKFAREQDASGQLQEDYGQAIADAKGTGFQYAQLANSRNLGKAQISQNAYSEAARIQASKPTIFDRIMQVGNLAVNGLAAYKT